MLDLIVVLNNYLHDLATGVLFAAGVAMAVLARRSGSGDPDAVAALRSLYRPMSRVALGALLWVLVAGVPRTIFFSRYEWDFAAVHGLLPVLAVKHALLFGAVLGGVVMWRGAGRLAARMPQPDARRQAGPPDEAAAS